MTEVKKKQYWVVRRWDGKIFGPYKTLRTAKKVKEREEDSLYEVLHDHYDDISDLAEAEERHVAGVEIFSEWDVLKNDRGRWIGFISSFDSDEEAYDYVDNYLCAPYRAGGRAENRDDYCVRPYLGSNK